MNALAKPCRHCGRMPWVGKVVGGWAVRCDSTGCQHKPGVEAIKPEAAVAGWNSLWGAV